TFDDAVPVVLSFSAFLGFAFLASMTSSRFSLLVTASVLLISIFQHLLEAPTRDGIVILSQLKGFREFLSRADADRLNRENRPGNTPETLEKYSAYAVALHVEKSWGEDVVTVLLQLLQMEQAHPHIPGGMAGTVADDGEPIQLNLGSEQGD